MRPLLPQTQIDDLATKKMASFHPDIVDEVKAAVATNKIVVVGMAQNPLCSKARRALKDAGKEFKYVEYGSYFSQWKRRLAIKLWSGWPTFPQVFIDGRLIGGCTDLQKWIQDGKLKN